MQTGLLTVRVARKHAEAEDICSFELVDPAGGALPPFTAGAHIDVHLPGGLVRQYSLCNDPREATRYVLAVQRARAGRGGSEAMHRLRQGDLVRIGAPRNRFALDHLARRTLLVAGGIGVTPLMSMAEELSDLGADFTLHYCARTRRSAAFADRLERAAYGRHVRLHFDDGPAAQRFDPAAAFAQPDAGTHLYVCGPGGFMEWCTGIARRRGWNAGQIHLERFAAPEAAAVPPASGAPALQVVLARSGREIAVPEQESIVACLARHGVAVPTSCMEGVCGTCMTRVLEGVPDHRDFYLSDAERARGDCFLPCCSRARTPRLVLDL